MSKRTNSFVLRVVLITLTVVISIAPYSHPQESSSWNTPLVLKIIAEQCLQDPIQRSQSGFRIKGQLGIVTALHGVVGCKQISALPGGSENAIQELKIEQVDVVHDAALLQSKTSPLGSADGFDTEAGPSYETLSVIGYPYGIAAQLRTSQIYIRQPPIIKLRSIIPQNSVPPLEQRNSPSLEMEVLSLEGHIVAGHSGAPILNGSLHVVGIANGGLRSGTTEITWAIPWSAVLFESATSYTDALVKLADLDPTSVFTFPGNLKIPGATDHLQTIHVVLITSEQVRERKKTKHVAEVKNDHPVVFDSHIRKYTVTLEAEPGATFTSCRFEETVAEYASGQNCEVPEGGRQIVFTFFLESSAEVTLDRYNGRLEGDLIGSEKQILEGKRIKFEKVISTSRRSDYILFPPSDLNLAEAQQVLIITDSDQVVAQGIVGHELTTRDYPLKFRVSANNGVLILTVDQGRDGRSNQ